MTKTVEEVRRAAFEVGMREILLGEGYCLLTVPEVMARGSDGRYSSVRVRGAWEGFNLALDAVEIQLPELAEGFADHVNEHAQTVFLDAIEQTGLGLKVKP
jgi:hypothetical protein